MIDERKIDGADVVVGLYADGTEYVVTYTVNGSLWHWLTFDSRDAADACFADPFASIRPRPSRAPELDRSYIERLTHVSRGRRIGPKPHAA